jgi:hypothetical protein
LCAQLQGILDAEAPVVVEASGRIKAHRAAVELRQHRVVLARLLVALRVPSGETWHDTWKNRMKQRS